MTTHNFINKDASTFSSFFFCVKSYLENDRKKYPMVFKFSETIKKSRFTNDSFDELLLTCWCESKSGQVEIFFTLGTDTQATYPISELPFEKCGSIQHHDDFIEDEKIEALGFASVEQYQLELGKVLTKKKKKIALDFSHPVFIPELAPKPKNRFVVYGEISRISENEGRTWINRICLFADRQSVLFNDADIVPYQHCTGITDTFDFR